MGFWKQAGQALGNLAMGFLGLRVYDQNSVICDIITANQRVTPLYYCVQPKVWNAMKWSIRVNGAPPLEIGQFYLYPRSIQGGQVFESSGLKQVPPNYTPIQQPVQQQVCPFTYVVNDRHPSVVQVSLLFLEANSGVDMQNIVPYPTNFLGVQTKQLAQQRDLSVQRIYTNVKDFLDGIFVYLSGYDDSFVLDDGWNTEDHPAKEKSRLNAEGSYLVLAYKAQDWIQSLSRDISEPNTLPIIDAPTLVFPDSILGFVSGLVSWDDSSS